jgi:hypothetical protein
MRGDVVRSQNTATIVSILLIMVLAISLVSVYRVYKGSVLEKLFTTSETEAHTWSFAMPIEITNNEDKTIDYVPVNIENYAEIPLDTKYINVVNEFYQPVKFTRSGKYLYLQDYLNSGQTKKYYIYWDNQSLIYWWKFNEGTGNVAYDTVANKPMYLYGGYNWGDGYVKFNGAGYGVSTLQNNYNVMSFSIFVNIKDTSDYRYLIEPIWYDGYYEYVDYYVVIENGYLKFIAPRVSPLLTPISFGTHHIVLTINGIYNSELYLDNKYIGKTPYTYWNPWINRIRIARYLPCDFYDLRMYDHILSANEVSQLYAEKENIVWFPNVSYVFGNKMTCGITLELDSEYIKAENNSITVNGRVKSVDGALGTVKLLVPKFYPFTINVSDIDGEISPVKDFNFTITINNIPTDDFTIPIFVVGGTQKDPLVAFKMMYITNKAPEYIYIKENVYVYENVYIPVYENVYIKEEMPKDVIGAIEFMENQFSTFIDRVKQDDTVKRAELELKVNWTREGILKVYHLKVIYKNEKTKTIEVIKER